MFYCSSAIVKIIEKDRTAKRVYAGECAGSRSVGRVRKARWNDTVKDCLKKRGLDVKQGKWCIIGVYGGGD